MKTLFKNQCIKLYTKVKYYVENQKGAQTLEWVAVGAVVVTIAAVLGKALKDGAAIQGVVTKIFEKIKEPL